MTDLDKAREWAERMGKIEGLMPGHRAAAEVIQSLPDQWVDVEKVREIIADMNLCLKMESTSDFSKGIDNATTSWRDALKALIYQKLPTLADMTQEGREACQWMQCEVFTPTLNETFRGVLTHPGKEWATDLAKVLSPDGRFTECEHVTVTPLPDLPKLKWPGSEPESTNFDNLPDEAKQVMKESIEDFKAGRFVDFDLEESDSDQQPTLKVKLESSIKSEDVPVDELWFVSTPFADGVGYRHHDQSYPWFVIYPSLAERTWHVWDDSQITLIHKLVPERPALPEGMRLADHEKFGRVVTSPWGDDDDDYKIFFLNEDARGGADYDFAHESELTFLDGGQHV